MKTKKQFAPFVPRPPYMIGADEDNKHIIYDVEAGDIIVECGNNETAAFIVCAVNSRAALLEVARDVKHFASSNMDNEFWTEMYEKSKLAIIQAEVK